MKPITVLIDADPLIYRIGFSVERRVWYVEQSNSDGRKVTGRYEDADRRDEGIRLRNLHPDEYNAYMISEPTTNKSIVFGRMKQQLRDIEQACTEYALLRGTSISGFELYLTGTGNFRKEVATIREYKGNRKDALRPFWYEDLRDYLILNHDAEVVDGMEADDAVSIRQWHYRNSIIVSVDKDLLNVPGRLWNPVSRKWHSTTREVALLNFYRQILTGDSTDNIPGCHKIGPRLAEKLLPDAGWSERAMWTVVVGAYLDNMAKYPDHHAPHVDPVACAIENARLLWMLTEEGEIWTPPIE